MTNVEIKQAHEQLAETLIREGVARRAYIKAQEDGDIKAMDDETAKMVYCMLDVDERRLALRNAIASYGKDLLMSARVLAIRPTDIKREG